MVLTDVKSHLVLLINLEITAEVKKVGRKEGNEHAFVHSGKNFFV